MADKRAKRPVTTMDGRARGRHLSSMATGIRDILKLGVPISIGRIGIVLMTTIDFMMVGHFSSAELSYMSIGNAPVMPLVVIGLGLLSGTAIMVANARGEGDLAACGLTWRRSLPYAFGIGVIGMILCFLAEPFLLLSGQTPDLALQGGQVMTIIGLGLPAFMIFLTSAFFLEGIGRPLPWVLLILIGNLINYGGNALFINDGLGWGIMGADGAAWATTISRCLVAVAIVAYICLNPALSSYAVRGSIWTGWASWRRQRTIGFAASIGGGADSIAFATMTIFAGWLGPLSLSGFSIVFNMLSIIFMITLGVGSATAVCAGLSYGRRQPYEVIRCGWRGFSVNSAFMAVIGLFLMFEGDVVAGWFTADPKLIHIVVPMLGLLAVILVVDGGQAVIASALRGCHDVWLPCGIQVTSYFALMIPMAYYLAFNRDFDALGLVLAMLIASVISCSLLILRFGAVLKIIRPDPEILADSVGKDV